MDTMSFGEGKKFLLDNLRAGVTPCLIGSPGVGKSSLVYQVAEEMNLPCHVLIGSNLDATDIGGFPVVSNGVLTRYLIPEIQAVCDAPGILFLDEWTTVPPSVRAPLMRLILEKKLQGGRSLHPESKIVCAMNPPDMCPQGQDLDAAAGNRINRTLFCPSLREVATWFEATVQGDESQKGIEFRDFALTLPYAPEVIQFDPPRASIETGAPFASPRAWELGLRAFAAHEGVDDRVGLALLAGTVGDEAALGYLAIRRMRADLPSVEAIVAEPDKALVPKERERQISALGVVSRVATEDHWAAWIYAGRLSPELGAACASFLTRRPETQGNKHERAGKQARVKLLAMIQKA